MTRPLHLLAKWEEKPQTGGYYYAPPAEQPIEAPKTADPGVALFAVLPVSLRGGRSADLTGHRPVIQHRGPPGGRLGGYSAST